MNFFSRMVNSWSIAWEVLNGTMDETYPIKEDIKITSRESDEYDLSLIHI